MGILLASLVLGCTGSAPVAPPQETASALDQGWIATVVHEPARFSGVVDGSGRDAWVAMHGARWAEAARGLPPGPARARAGLETARLYQDLADLAAVAWPTLTTSWQQRDPAIAQGPLPFLAAVALAGAGQPAPQGWTPTPDQASFLAAIDGGDAALPEDGLDAGGCLRASLDLLVGRRTGLAAGCDGERALDLGVPGSFHDPLLYAAMAADARTHAAADLPEGGWAALATAPDPGLELLLFGPWWAAADLATTPELDLAGGGGPTLDSLGLPSAGESDDPQAARERVRALDKALDAWERTLAEAATADGQALLSDLRLVAQVRSRTLLAWARQALAQDRPHQATAYLLLAHDVENARKLGPLNPPSLYVLAAHASLRTGRTREALDYLSVLEQAFPEIRGLDETVGDLAVLEGLGRNGDSKEN